MGEPAHEGKVFEFCKTHGMPYEAAVLACLFILRHHVGEEFSYSVDEKIEKLWSPAAQAISDTLGWTPSQIV